MLPIHDRMPVIIEPKGYAAWLDPRLTDADLVRKLSGEFPADQMEAYPVGRAAGNPRSEVADLVRRIDAKTE